MHCEGMRLVSAEGIQEGGISEKAVLKDMMQTELHRESEDFDPELFGEFLEVSHDQPLEEYAERFWKNNYRRFPTPRSRQNPDGS